MKYIFTPISRLFYVLLCIACLPVFYFVAIFISAWNWNTEEIKDVTEAFFDHFHSQEDMVEVGQKYWVYKNPYHYLIKKKTFKVRELRSRYYN